MRQTNSTGSDSSLSTCMSSREPSTSPQAVPKKRSFTITSIENGKFQLNFDLRFVPSSPPLTSPSSPIPIITTTPTPLSPPSSTSSLANGLIHPASDKAAEMAEHPLQNGTERTDSPNEAHLISRLTNRDNDSCTPIAQQNHELSPSNPDLSPSDHDRGSSGRETPTIGSSVDSLLDDSPKPGKKSKRRKGWFGKKKTKSKHLKQQMSLQESKTDRPPQDTQAKKQRSKSHDVAFDGGEDDKRQSLSRGGGGGGGSDGTDAPRKNTLMRRRSNTIIDKYRAIVDAQKKKEVPRVVKEKLESLPRFVDVRVGEMSVEEFRESLFCTQLEYKLRAALQNVHTSLTSDLSGGVRGGEVAKPDLKWQVMEACTPHSSSYHVFLLSNHEIASISLNELHAPLQVTSLLERALQRSRWVHDNMESALISETLKMVSQLPTSL